MAAPKNRPTPAQRRQKILNRPLVAKGRELLNASYGQSYDQGADSAAVMDAARAGSLKERAAIYKQVAQNVNARQRGGGEYAALTGVTSMDLPTGLNAARSTALHGTSMSGVTNDSIASSATSEGLAAAGYAEADLSRTGTAASQGKAYEAMYGTDAGTVLHAESVPSSAQTSEAADTASGGGGPGGGKKHPGRKVTQRAKGKN